MSKERELLRRISSHSESRIPIHFIKEIQQLLAQPEQPEAWIVVNKETGYRTQVSHFPDSYDKNTFEVIPLYTAPPKRKLLGDGITADMYRANKKATHPDSYWAGVNDAEKAHGIGVDDE